MRKGKGKGKEREEMYRNRKGKGKGEEGKGKGKEKERKRKGRGKGEEKGEEKKGRGKGEEREGLSPRPSPGGWAWGGSITHTLSSWRGPVEKILISGGQGFVPMICPKAGLTSGTRRIAKVRGRL